MKQTLQHADSPVIPPRDQYQYETLIAQDAVRILALEPADDFQSPLRCSIIQHRQTDDPLNPDGSSYTAVSYAWGDPKPSHDLSVRLHVDVDAWAFLRITANVDTMLRYFRKPHKATLLWIDAICLNQNDETEKTQQIPLMGRIYDEAERVHIWLGHEEADEAQEAFSIVRHAKHDSGFHLRDQEVLCLARLFNRPWFTRRWIIQEVVFAHDAIFHSGSYILSLSRVMAFLERVKDAGTHGLLGRGSQMLLSVVSSHQRTRKRLLPIMWDLHKSACSDPRDRIQAVYALASGSKWPLRQYDQSQWDEMYTDVAAHYINHSAATSTDILLHLCDFGPVQPITNNGVPSWVPNWASSRQELFFPSDVEAIRHGKGSAYKIERMIQTWKPELLCLKEVESKRLHQENVTLLERDSSIMKVEASGRRLRIDYHPCHFLRCGIADKVIDPSISKDSWEAVVVSTESAKQSYGDWLTDRGHRKVKGHGRRLIDSPYCVEEKYLYHLLVNELARQENEPSQLIEPIDKLFHDLCASRIDGRHPPTPNGEQKTILRDWFCALSCQHRLLVRVQTMTTYYWAIGPVGLLPGDWLVPMANQGQVYNAPLLCIRPTSPHGDNLELT